MNAYERRARAAFAALAVLLAAACGDERASEFERAIGEDSGVTAYWSPREDVDRPTPEAGRRDTSWWSAPSVDTILRTDTLIRLPNDAGVYRPPRDSYRIPETWDDLEALSGTEATRETEGARGAEATGASVLPLDPFSEMHLPLGGQVEGPSVLYAQILLDRSPFSPGAIDGRWGSNTERAVFWFQRARGLAPTGQVDSTTLRLLYETAETPRGLLARYVVRGADVEGPLEPLPDDVYARDSLDCLCYESAAERLSERVHATVDLLAELNPDVDLEALAPGDTIVVPSTGELEPGADADRPDPDDARAAPDGGAIGHDTAAGATADDTAADATDDDTAAGAVADDTSAGAIAELVVSDRGRYVHAVDASGNVLFHFPATLGSRYHPSPGRTLTVVSISRDPAFHYQPALLAGVHDTLPDTFLPPGPNSPVGVVWIQLSEDHYGIHGTDEPGTIGHTHSSGCVRLTNWDAAFLAERLRPGVPVRFVDLEG